MPNTPGLKKTDEGGKWYGKWMYPQRLRLLYGELAPISSLLGIIFHQRKKQVDRGCLLVMPTTTRNLCSPYMGMSFRSKCLGISEGESAEMQQWSPGFLSSVRCDGRKADSKGIRKMGSSVLGNLECKKQVLFWENSSTAIGDPGRGFGSFGDISACFSHSRELLGLVFFFFCLELLSFIVFLLLLTHAQFDASLFLYTCFLYINKVSIFNLKKKKKTLQYKWGKFIQ